MGLGIGNIERTKNTAELIADALRSAIVQGKLKSGQSLKQDEIASEFSVSKIPVREALVQLQTEGLVNLIPNRGAVVSRLSLAETDEIYLMRRALEPLALRKAIPHLTETDLDEAEHFLNRIDNVDHLSHWAELNWEFHNALYAPANLPRLVSMTRDLHNNVTRMLVFILNEPHLKRSQQEHRQLLALCRAKDIEGACNLLETHLNSAVAMFAERIQEID